MLVDSFGRNIDYVRISVTDHCNLRCVYCMPGPVQWLPHHQILRNEEIVQLVDIFVSLGIKKVRFTGGEPLLRKGFFDIVKQVRSNHNDLEICITTNGMLLENFVNAIKEYNVQKVNVSLDTLDPTTFTKITGVNGLDRVVRGIEKVSLLPGVECKINAVIMNSTLDELEQLVNFATHVDAIRFIERMPLSNDPVPFVSADTLINALHTLGTLQRKTQSDTHVAAMYKFQPKGKSHIINIGIIPAVSHRFCSRCNRLRVTPDGMLRACLHDTTEYNVKNILRGQFQKDIKEVIQQAVLHKKKEHSLTQCDDTVFNCSGMTLHSMSKIGG
ncbi:MAG: GTP 3',8-cyclase MoaA [Spirochaetes bacterium]|nr:GTP 3',8-cyclase MoaA [Spirochaetota bacterium]